jgi:hypothetical protein
MFKWLRRTVNPVWESMTRYEHGDFVVRVWRETSENRFGPDRDVDAICTKAFPLSVYRWDEEDLVRALAQLDGVSAVELTCRGQGFVYYPDWK